METTIHKPRLLLIEDNSDTRQIYKDVFERDGFQVLMAEDGEKGLSYAQSTLPDVILLDLMLPKLSGFDLLKQLRAKEETRDIPVMIFSALGDAADRKKAAELGVTEYSMKASNPPKHVVNRVRALLTKVERTAASEDAPEAFTVALKESSADIRRLCAQAGLLDGLQCPQCQGEIVMGMINDATRTPGHWFVAHLVCSGCRRTF